MKTKEKNQARELRKQKGWSIRQIADQLGVATSSVSLWVRDIKLSQEQHIILLAKNPAYNNQINGAKARSESAKKKRKEYQKIGEQIASQKKDWLFGLGCAIYWAEGSKGKNSAIVSNTDPYLLKMWIKFLETHFSVQKNELVMHMHWWENPGTNINSIEEYWLETLNLSRQNLRKSTIIKQHPMSTQAKKNKHPHGICRIVLHNTEITQKIFGAIKYLANIKEDRWLG